MEDRLKRTVGILMILWKNKIKMDKNYWENRYQEQETGWDIGYVSTPIKSYFDQISDKNISILVPGAGHAYEAEYLHFLGFKNVTVIDIAQIPLDNFSKRFPDFPNKKLICSDFFDHSGSYDLILEQTFFCALNPEIRKNYVKQAANLLTPKGKMVGVLFDFPLTEQGPPFGGSKKEYENHFEPYFRIKTLEPCFNSILPRLGRELFFIFEKKS